MLVRSKPKRPYRKPSADSISTLAKKHLIIYLLSMSKVIPRDPKNRVTHFHNLALLPGINASTYSRRNLRRNLRGSSQSSSPKSSSKSSPKSSRKTSRKTSRTLSNSGSPPPPLGKHEA